MDAPISSNLTPQVREALKRKILQKEELKAAVAQWKLQNPSGVVGWTNGVFDLLHPGHVRAIEQCRVRCDLLLVGVNSDASTRRLKGEGRPKVTEIDRAMMLAAMPSVAYVTIFDEDFPEQTIDDINPHIVMKGKEWAGKPIAGTKGRALYLFDRHGEFSTTKALEKPPVRQEPFPQCCHMFWSGPGFTYAHYLAVLSALRVHTPSSLYLWTVDPPNSEWWNKLYQHDEIAVMSAIELLGVDLVARHERAFEKVKEELEAYHPAAKIAQVKDMAFWRALWKYGGISLDMDTLSYRRFWPQFLTRKKSFLAGGIPGTGVMGALIGSPIARWLDEWCEKNVEELGQIGDLWNTWTFYGPTALIHYVNELGISDIEIAPTDWFYKFCKDLDAFFVRDAAEVDLDDVRVLHIYGEGRREMPNSTDPDVIVTPEFVASSPCVYAKIAREVLGEDLGIAPLHEEEAIEHRTLCTPGEVVAISPHEQPMVEIDQGKPLSALTVIMKDEREHVREALESVKDTIDQWILVDTGSSDGTQDEARAFFEEHGIPEIPDADPKAFGYGLYEREWRGYALSRQEALELCLSHCNEQSYVVKLDMDERVVNSKWIKFAIEQANPDVLYLFCYQHDDPRKVRFGFPRAWHVRTNPRYTGSDHEIPLFDTQQLPFYLEVDLPEEERRCYVIHKHGPRGADGLADTIMLQSRDIDAARAQGERHLRAEFYLGRDVSAVSLRQGEYWLRRRLSADDDWQEERFFTHLYLGDNLHRQQRVDEALEQWGLAHEILPDAREPLLREGSIAFVRAVLEEEKGADGMGWWKKCADAYEKALPLGSKPDMILFEECACYDEETLGEISWRLAVARWKIAESPENAREALEQLDKAIESDPQEEAVREWKRIIGEKLRAAPGGKDPDRSRVGV